MNRHSSNVFGWLPSITSGSQGLTTANTYYSMAFVATATKTLSKVRVFISTVTGTLGTGDFRCDIYSDDASTGKPSSSLVSSTTITAVPTSSSWLEFTGFSQALTVGVRYHAVFRNLNASPASNNFTINHAVSGPMELSSGSTSWGWSTYRSTDAASSWAQLYSRIMGLRLVMSDGTFMGLPVENALEDNSATYAVYQTRELGVRFTSPANAKLNVLGGGLMIRQVTTPTNRARLKLYVGGTLVATSHTVGGTSAAINYFSALFPSTVTIDAGSDVRLVISEDTNSDTSTNRYTSGYVRWENTAGSLADKPCEGTVQWTYFNGTSWAEVANFVPAFVLILDSPEFTSAGGSGGVAGIGSTFIVPALG